MNRPEQLVWKALRKLDDNWRRQAPIGRFVVDFANHGRRLVIEVDGGVHRLPEVALKDAGRDAWLRSQGYSVVRLDGQAVIRDLQGALRSSLGDIYNPSTASRTAFANRRGASGV